MKNTGNVVPISGSHAACGECRFTPDCLAVDPEDGGRGRRPASRVPGRIVRRGTHVFRMGDHFDALYTVRSGAVKTYVVTEDGDQQVTGFYTAGEVFGLDSIDGFRYASNAVALDTSCVCVLSWDHLTRLCSRSPVMQRRLVQRMSRKIREDDHMILLLGQKSADQRVAAFLVSLADKQARLGFSPRTVNLPMSRGDIGSYLRLAVETVSRALTRLQDAGHISVDRNRIDVHDGAALATIAGEAPASESADAAL